MSLGTTEIALVIPTRGRGGRVVKAIQSVLAGDYQGFEIVVVDQSIDADTQKAIAAFEQALPDPSRRLRYLRSRTRGLSNALNVGIAATTSPTIAITGDDCEAAPTWLSSLATAMADDDRIGVVFGRVGAGPHDEQRGFVQAYPCTRRFLARRYADQYQVGGTSACMAIRRKAWHELHGFDPMLGVGAPFLAAEEVDLKLAALRSGYWVLEEPAAEVTHHGFMEWRELPGLIERNWFGTGAALAKQLKLLPTRAPALLTGLAWSWAFARSGVASSLGGGLHRRRRLLAFGRGMLAGLRCPINPRTNHYQPRA